MGVYYDGNQFQYLSMPGYSGGGPECYLARQNNTLLVGGGFAGQFGTTFGVAQWDGNNTWVDSPYSVGNPLPVTAMLEFNGQVYVAGHFTDPANHIAVHNGTQYSPVGDGFDQEVYDLIVYNGELYAAGGFTMSGSTSVAHIAKWTGSAWVDVGGGLDNDVLDLEVFNGELYASGMFSHAGGAPVFRLAKWNGVTWSDVGGGITTQFNAWPRALCATSAGLFVGGRMSSGGGVPLQGIGLWNGTNWVNPGFLPSLYFEVAGIAEFQGMIYLATMDVSTTPFYTAQLYRQSSAIAVPELSDVHVSIGPNPANDHITLMGVPEAGLTYDLIDVQGHVLSSGTYEGKISVSALDPGTYVLKTHGSMQGFARFAKL